MEFLPESSLPAMFTAVGVIFTAIGASIGVWLKGRGDVEAAALATQAAIETAEATASATIKTVESDARDKLIDQLQEELGYYRDSNDKRSARLEAYVDKMDLKFDKLSDENRKYREFIGIHRDLMAQNGLQLPIWPEDLSR